MILTEKQMSAKQRLLHLLSSLTSSSSSFLFLMPLGWVWTLSLHGLEWVPLLRILTLTPLPTHGWLRQATGAPTQLISSIFLFPKERLAENLTKYLTTWEMTPYLDLGQSPFTCKSVFHPYFHYWPTLPEALVDVSHPPIALHTTTYT